MGLGDELAQGGTIAMKAIAIKAMQILYDILKNLAKSASSAVIIGGKELIKERQLKIKGQINIGQLNKLLERTGRGKQLMTVPKEQLAALKAECKKYGVPFAIVDTGRDNTVSVCMSDRDAAAFSDICRNVAMQNLSAKPESFFHDSDSRGVDADVAKRVYATADIPQMTFRKPDGTTITQVDKAHEKAYLKAKQNMVIPLSREMKRVDIMAIDEHYGTAVRGRNTFAELDKQEAYGINHQLSKHPGLDVTFYEKGDKVVATYPIDKEAEFQAMREHFKLSRDLADKVKLSYNAEKDCITFDSGAKNFDIAVAPEKNFRIELDKHLHGTPTADNELFKSMLMRDVHKTLTNTPNAEKATDIYNYDIFQNHMVLMEVPNTEYFMNSLSLARDVLQDKAERLGGEVSDTGGICVFDNDQKQFRVFPVNFKDDIAETIENTFRYSEMKAEIIAEKMKSSFGEDLSLSKESALEEIGSKNPLLSDVTIGRFNGGYSLFNTIGSETLGYVIAQDSVSRTEIEKALSDTLGIDDPKARAELMSKLDDKGILPKPQSIELEDSERGKIKISTTTADYSAIQMPNGDTVMFDRKSASTEAIAERLSLDRETDKSLIKSINRAISEKNTRPAFSEIVKSAVNRSETAKQMPDISKTIPNRSQEER
jgi:hypothetical protein